MTGLTDTDIRLSDEWQLTQAADGDAPLCSGLECLYQNIILEALTQPGDLFYDLTFGWGLYDFIQSEDDDLTRLEIAQRPGSDCRSARSYSPKVSRSTSTSRTTPSFSPASSNLPRRRRPGPSRLSSARSMWR